MKFKKKYLFFSLLFLLLASYRKDLKKEKIVKKYSLPTSKFINISGTNVHYTDEGKGDVILLIHGTFASLHTWNNWANTLKQNYRVIRLDLPGFGLTGPGNFKEYTIENYVSFLHEFDEKLDLPDFNIAGNSLGGNLAWEYAWQYPNKIKKLILIDAAGFAGLKSKIIIMGNLPLMDKILSRFTPKFLTRVVLMDAYYDRKKLSKEKIQQYYDISLCEGNRLAALKRIRLPNKDNSHRLKELKCPTLIMWGDHDRWINPQKADFFARDIKNSQKIIYENVGHVPMEEVPEQSVRDLGKFLLN